MSRKDILYAVDKTIQLVLQLIKAHPARPHLKGKMSEAIGTGKESALRVLHLEDDPRDVELIAEWLEDEGIACEITNARTEPEFRSGLQQAALELIISDYHLPTFDGLKALAIAHERRPEVPFILFSGTIGEEFAVESLKQGASDYVLKQRPQRLIAAVRQAIAVAEQNARSKAAENRMREQAALLDKTQDAILVQDMEDRITFWNRGAERLYGWNAAEAIGQNGSQLLTVDSLQHQDALRKVSKQGEWVGELNQVRRDGKAVVVESRWSLLHDSQGRPEAKLIINTDVTERKQLEAQFLRAQRMESIGALTGGIAHDLNNVLAPILMGLDLLNEELPANDRTQMLATMKGCGQRGAEMVKQILSFARGVGGQMAVLQIKIIVAEMGRLAKDTFPRSIHIRVKTAPDLPPVVGNATQLHQVLLNLCVNARDAMPTGGDLQLTASPVLLKDYVVKGNLTPVSGSFIVLSVSDTGHGMTPEVLAKIFEPFFTTKGEGKGTGLGLSTVVGIAKSHNGFVEASSEVAKGTIFKVYLPAAPNNELSMQEGNITATAIGSGEQILVVDDELAFLEMTRETLEAFNYRVMVAQNGAEAVAAYRRHAGEIQAVITDMMMPTMDGPATIDALREIDPDVKIIGVSGLGSELALMKADKLAVRAFLKKPYTTATLLTSLREVLKERE
jgi:two-component system, cell cycle sensor histidine kinase and response regulator CckA